MKRALIAVLGTFLLLTLGGAAASRASAIEFTWHVNGSKLEAGKEKAWAAFKAKTSFIFKATIAGVKFEVVCTKLTVLGGAKIIGGVPGTAASVTLQFSGCTCKKPLFCRVKNATFTTKPLVGEIVEGVGLSAGKRLIVLHNVGESKEEEFGTIELEKETEEGLLCFAVDLKGRGLAEFIPQAMEVETLVLKFEPANGKEYKTSGGVTEKAGLMVSGSAATLTGEAETKLSPVEKFGAF